MCCATHAHDACSVGKLCGDSREEAVVHVTGETGEEFFYADGVFVVMTNRIFLYFEFALFSLKCEISK